MNRLKWLILASFSLLIGVNQLLWLTFATIVISTQEYFGVSEFKANLLTLIFPAVYVLLSIHSGSLLDKKGYKNVVSMAALLMLAGSIIRVFGENAYWIVFFGQFLIALSQPYMTNAINQITSDWFPTHQLNTATGLMIGGLFFGMAVGAFLSPVLLTSIGFQGMLQVNVAITVVVVLLFLVIIKEPTEKSVSHSHPDDQLDPRYDAENTSPADFSFFNNKRLWGISFIVFIAMGYFNGLTNWLAPIIEPRGMTEEQAGIITAMLIFGGIIGAVCVPLLSDILNKRRIFIVLALIAGASVTYPLLTTFSYTTTLAMSFILGFVLLAGYPLLIASAEQIVPHEHTAKAVSLTQLMGNMGGVMIVLLMEAVKNVTGEWSDAIYILVGIMVLALPLAWRLRDLTEAEITGYKHG